MNKLITVGLLVALTGLSQGCIVIIDNGGSACQARSELKQTLAPVSGPLVVDTRNGRIDVVAESRDDVSIECTLVCGGRTQSDAEQRLAMATLLAEVDAEGRLVVKPVFPGGPRSGDGASIWIRVPTVGPDGADLKTSNGPIVARGLRGELIADTSNGGIDVSDHTGSARVDTSNGPIVVRNITGSVWADTSNGSVRLEEVSGPITADTSNGSIVAELTGVHAGPIVLDTSNASIRVRVGGQFAGPIRLSTSNGGIRVHDPHGRISSQTLSRNSGDLQIGDGGGATSRFDTSNGSIDVTIEG